MTDEEREQVEEEEEEEEELLSLDPTCPYCNAHSCVGEIFDGGEWDCMNCGRLIVACAWTDGTMSMVRPSPDPYANPRTGRQRTRARWRRQGRR